MNAALNVGARLNMLPSFLVQDLLKLLYDPNAISFAAVPAMYNIMISHPNIQKRYSINFFEYFID